MRLGRVGLPLGLPFPIAAVDNSYGFGGGAQNQLRQVRQAGLYPRAPRRSCNSLLPPCPTCPSTGKGASGKGDTPSHSSQGPVASACSYRVPPQPSSPLRSAPTAPLVAWTPLTSQSGPTTRYLRTLILQTPPGPPPLSLALIRSPIPHPSSQTPLIPPVRPRSPTPSRPDPSPSVRSPRPPTNKDPRTFIFQSGTPTPQSTPPSFPSVVPSHLSKTPGPPPQLTPGLQLDTPDSPPLSCPLTTPETVVFPPTPDTQDPQSVEPPLLAPTPPTTPQTPQVPHHLV